MSHDGGVTLALGGGGARGLAHVGVLQVLEREGIAVRAVAGTSMGGLVAAHYAAGVSLEEVRPDIARLSRPAEWLKLLDLRVSRDGVSLKGARIYERLAERLGGELQFDGRRMPLALVAVDLNSGREVVLREGSVPEAVRATISLPGVFRPVERDGMRLVDGGLRNNVPVEVARSLMPSRPVVAVDVLPTFDDDAPEPGTGAASPTGPSRATGFPAFLQESMHISTIMISAMTTLRLAADPPDVLLRPALPDDVTVLTGYGRGDEIIEAGRVAAQQALPTLRELTGS